jgi:hypothetical protein
MSNKMLCHKKQDIRDSSRIMELSITVKQLIIKVKQVYYQKIVIVGYRRKVGRFRVLP